MGIKPYGDYARFREILNQVNQAALERRRVEMAYHPLHRQEKTLRKVDPYKVWFYDGTIYLIGRCHLRKEVRMFVLDRIKMLNITGERFTMPKDFSLDDFMRDSFKVMHDELCTVRVQNLLELDPLGGRKRSGMKARNPSGMETGVLNFLSGWPAWMRSSAGY